MRALEGHSLDFFLMLSSAAAVVGNLAQASYAAANAFMDAVANDRQSSCGTHFISLSLGPVSDVGAVARSGRVQQGLMRQGYVLIQPEEFLALVEYAMSGNAKDRSCRQIVAGFDYRSFAESENARCLRNPMFSHLLPSKAKEGAGSSEAIAQDIEGAIATAESFEEAQSIAARFITQKFTALAAIDTEYIDLNRRVADLGIDSLMVIELRNWISQTFRATLQASEVSDSPSIVSLAKLVVARSAIFTKTISGKVSNCEGVSNAQTDDLLRCDKTLPKQPLPDLDESLDLYLSVVQSIFTEEEYAETLEYANELRKPNGFGRELHSRLECLANDPDVDNWQESLYTKGVHLRMRTPLVPRHNFFGSHLESPFPHAPAERAAIISQAAFQFKENLEAGEIEYEIVNGQRKENDLYKWLFNATRVPGIKEDKMEKHKGNDFLVAFRRGHAFKIPLRDAAGPIPYEMLKSHFQSILDMEYQGDSWVSVLTMDNRDLWAEVRVNALMNPASD